MRLITRPDLDGITCAVLLSEVESIDQIEFVEPHAMQSGQVEVGPDHIIANLPHHPRCGLWFDHHASNAPAPDLAFRGAFHVDPSAARTVYNYYSDPRLDRFGDLLEATDRVDAAQLSLEDVLHPEGYVLLSLTLDPRSNLDHSDRYCHDLVQWLRTQSLEAILQIPDVAARCRRILDGQQSFEALVREWSRAEKNVVITDFRTLSPQPVGSRFLVYALFPDCNTSLKLYPSRGDANRIGLSVGHSIFNRTQPVSSGALCARFGGGGHFGAGSCVVDRDNADTIVAEMLRELTTRPPS